MPDRTDVECDTCGGLGMVYGKITEILVPIKNYPRMKECPDCHGTGIVNRTPPQGGNTDKEEKGEQE